MATFKSTYFQLASIRASLELYNEAGMENLREKGDNLTGYLEWLLETNCGNSLEIVTPKFEEGKQTRGSMLCVRVKGDAKNVEAKLKEAGAVVDFREPDILRMAPIPIYNSFEDVFELVEVIKSAF